MSSLTKTFTKSAAKAYILSGHIEDNEKSSVIRFLCKGESGPLEVVITNARPVFFIERKTQLPDLEVSFERKSLELSNFSGVAVDALYFGRQGDSYKARDILTAKGIRTFEADINMRERFLMEHFINGAMEISGEHTVHRGIKRYLDPQIKSVDTAPKLSTISLDLETSADNDLYSIGLHFKDGKKEIKKVFMVGSEENTEIISFFPTEEETYQAFEDFFSHLDPDIIIGWHVIGFDIAFLERKCQQWNRPLRLGRRASECKVIEKQRGGSYVRIEGRVVLDGPTSLRTCFYSFEDFKLDTVANAVLGTGKDISLTNQEKIDEINRRFREDKHALAKYNLLDCTLVTDIFEKVGLLELMIERSLISGMPLDRVGLAVASFDHLFLPRLHRKKMVAPNAVDIMRIDPTTGGYVMEPKAGFHEHIVVLDFVSLYPSIIRTFKIDPYSRIMKDTLPLNTPGGNKFSKSEHILPDIISDLMKRREEAKKNDRVHLAQAIKILMNSLYGVMGSASSRFYHSDLPSSITQTGRWLLKNATRLLEEEGYSVLYGDTDSLFIKLKPGEWIAPLEKGKQLTKMINRHLTQIIKNDFSLESVLNMKFETYYRKFHLPQAGHSEGGAKKRYVGLTQGENGTEEIKFVGMEFVRSDWTLAAKEFQHHLFDKIFKGQGVEEYIKEFVEEIKSGRMDEKLIYKKRLVKKLNEYKKSIPPHVKAAILAKEKGIDLRGSISYVITKRGPMPVELSPSDIDHQHYIERQIRPITDRVMCFQNRSFNDIVVGSQLSLF